MKYAPENGPAWHNLLLCLALFGLAAADWLAPGVTRPYPALSIVLGGVVAMAAGLTFFSHRTSRRSVYTLYLALAMLVWLFLSSAFSIDSFRSQQTLASWVGGLAFFFLVTTAISSQRRWTFFVQGVSLIATLVTAYGLLHLEKKGHLIATFSNQDNFSVLPLTAIFLLLSQIYSRELPLKALASAEIVVLGLGLIRTTSRAAIAGAVLGFIVMAVTGKLRRSKPKKVKSAPLVLILFGVVAGLALVSGLLKPLLGRVTELQSGADSQGVTMRVDVLIHGLETSLGRPVAGYGPGTFALAYQRHRPESVLPEYIQVNVAHNDYVEAAVEFGWIGFALLGGIYLLTLLRGIRLIRHDLNIWEARCCLGCVSAILGYSALNFAIPVPALLFLEFSCLAALHALPAGPMNHRLSAPTTLLVSLILLASGGWTIIFGLKSLRVNQLVAQAQTLSEALRFEEALPKLSEAIATTPKNSALYIARGTLQLDMGSYKKSAEMLAQAGKDLTKAVQLSPYDSRATVSLVRYYRNTQQFGQAEEAYKLELKNRPYLANGYRELARLQLLQKKYASAAETLAKASLSEEEMKSTLVPLLVTLEVERPHQAIELLTSWAKEEDREALVHPLLSPLAETALKANELDIADRFLEFALTQDPNNLEVAYDQARILLRRNKKSEASAQLKKILNQPEPSANGAKIVDRALVDWARLQPTFVNNPGVFSALDLRLRKRPRAIPVRLLLSEILLRQKKLEAAEDLITRGLDQDPESAELLARMGTCMMLQGMGDLAPGYFDQALRIDAHLSEARVGQRKQLFRFTDQ